jgi:hypothetical protein
MSPKPAWKYGLHFGRYVQSVTVSVIDLTHLFSRKVPRKLELVPESPETAALATSNTDDSGAFTIVAGVLSTNASLADALVSRFAFGLFVHHTYCQTQPSSLCNFHCIIHNCAPSSCKDGSSGGNAKKALRGLYISPA